MIAVAFVLGVAVIAGWWVVEGPAQRPGCPECGTLSGHLFGCPKAWRRDEGWTDPLDDPAARGKAEDDYYRSLTGEGRFQ